MEQIKLDSLRPVPKEHKRRNQRKCTNHPDVLVVLYSQPCGGCNSGANGKNNEGEKDAEQMVLRHGVVSEGILNTKEHGYAEAAQKHRQRKQKGIAPDATSSQ